MTAENIFKRRRPLIYAVCTVVCATGILLSGNTLAYFTSTDSVTNVHRATDVKIELIEQEWDSTGKDSAAKLEPGMTIDKDPTAVNRSEKNVYVRMKIEITYKDGTAPTDAEKSAILGAIYHNYTYTEKNKTVYAKCTVSELTTTNSSFKKIGDWYYYALKDTAGDGAGNLAELAPDEQTPTLFDSIEIPVTKSGYAPFSKDFKITVHAQAITVSALASDADDKTVAAAFDSAVTS